MQALLIGWPFATFLQGVGGFGVPTAVTAPLLIGLGFAPLTAVVVPSIGHAWSVTFGSLGSSFNALMAASGLGWEQLAATSAILLGLLGYGCGIGAGHAAQGWRAVRRLAVVIFVLGTVMGLTQYLLATNGLWNLAGFGAGLAGMVVGYLMAREGRPSRALLLAMSAYLALIVITVVVQLVPVVRDALGGPEIRLGFPELSTARGYTTLQGLGRVIPIFTHAGALLVYANHRCLSHPSQRGSVRPWRTPKNIGGHHHAGHTVESRDRSSCVDGSRYGSRRDDRSFSPRIGDRICGDLSRAFTVDRGVGGIHDWIKH